MALATCKEKAVSGMRTSGDGTRDLVGDKRPQEGQVRLLTPWHGIWHLAARQAFRMASSSLSRLRSHGEAVKMHKHHQQFYNVNTMLRTESVACILQPQELSDRLSKAFVHAGLRHAAPWRTCAHEARPAAGSGRRGTSARALAQ